MILTRKWIVLLPALALAACQPAADGSPDAARTEVTGSESDAGGVASVFDGTAGRWVDLTHPFDEAGIYWPTDTVGFEHEELAYGVTEGGWFYASYRFSGAEHGGTHLDAPIHFAEGRRTVDEVPLSSLIGPAAVVDVSERASPDYQVSVEDLTAWEAEHGRIPGGAILLLRTGWGERYGDRAAYLGTARTGPDAVPQLHFPGLAPEAARWLVENRSIAALGLDTPSVDYGQSGDFGSHVILYSENIPGFENVAHLERLPATGAYVVALPMKIAGGSGGPLRIVAFVPESSADASTTASLELVTIQYRVARDAYAPSQFVALIDGGMSPPLEVVWDLGAGSERHDRDALGERKSEFDRLIRDLEARGINGVEFSCQGEWLIEGARLRLTSVPEPTDAGKEQIEAGG